MDLALDGEFCKALMSRLSFGTTYQWVLIVLGLVASLLFGAFFYRELFPEYRIYQKDYVALEQFRSTYTHEPPPVFKEGVKQILIEREDKGPPLVDRCISCHVALQVEAFSPTKIEKDLNGNIVYDAFGVPSKVENPDYIWLKLEEALPQHPELAALKTAHVGDHTYDVRKVLKMHPLMGRETRPFEYHPIEEYGCTSCHGGNGNGLVTDRAHGPVFDGEYEEESRGFVPQFLEKDPENDPPFSRVFNAKPGHRLLFQTNPLYVGALIQAKCMQCHQSSQDRIMNAANSATVAIERNKKEIAFIQKGLDFEKDQVASLLMLRQLLKKDSYATALEDLKKQSEDYSLPRHEKDSYSANYKFLKGLNQENASQEVENKLVQALGDVSTIELFEKEGVERALAQKQTGSGTLFEKVAALNNSKELIQHIHDVSGKFNLVQDENAIGQIQSDIDLLTKDYQRGQALFLSQGCYACHRIAGRSRGGVGPELSRSGDGYPWFVKESIVWPQADLRTSTMPNLKLDHEELEALTTYLLGQSSRNKTMSDTEKKISLTAWEGGKKMPWELPVSKENIQNLNYGMTVFAVEGCASCHRLKGYESNTGFKAETDKKWFETLFPESILGSQIVSVIEKNQKEIDARILDNVREGSLLEAIEAQHPGAIEALYSNFKFALRAKKTQEGNEKEWKARVNRVLKMYIQTYGLGRLICPRPNWAGVYRSDQWLMEHFKNPTSHVPHSIMPVYPFDDSKFTALTYTLDRLGDKNREVGKFEPAQAFNTYCAQCHGMSRQGDGPVSEWIYPIPKNLLRAEFLLQLTKEQAIESITHGVKGTPMPPWGEVGEGKETKPILTKDEIKELVDWLYSALPLQSVLPGEKESPKWNYQVQDVMQELKNEGAPEPEIFDHGYIKHEFYTSENIEAGKRFFIENCAPCHGKEADGTGLRAEAMADAKPRMLTNLDWISSRDDLRLLRSIKYGVPGTAMTPWGDLTSAKQRLQLVVFIRSLTREAEERRKLTDAIYKKNNEEKEIYYKIGMGFITLGASEKIQQEWLEIILGKGSEKALLESIDQENGAEWKKQKENVISGLAEIKRMEKK